MSGAKLRRCKALASGAMATFVLLLSTGSASGQEPDPHAHHRQMMQQQTQQESKPGSADVLISDVRLLTQDGDSVNLRNDVIGDRIVVIDFVYTTCTTFCPLLSAILGQVQRQLEDRLGKDVILVSVTVDPLRDTPARLKAYSKNHRAGDGWVWLTGDKETVDGVLRDFGVYTPNFQDHPSTVLVGDPASGQWSRFIGFPGAAQLVEKINEFSAARTSQSALRE